MLDKQILKKKHHENTFLLEFSNFQIFNFKFSTTFFISHSFIFYIMTNIMFNFSKNWNVWLSIIRIKTTKYSIWNFIDLFTNSKFVNKLKFKKLDLNQQIKTNFNEKLIKYKIVASKYKKKFQNWKKKKTL